MSKSNETTPNVPTLRFKDFVDNWTIATLGDVCSYRKERRITEKRYYVSTENILQNYQGIECFDSNEKISGDAFDKNDVLMGNIRPYLKKVCFANFDGVCNADVLVFKSETLNPKYLHCILANDSFINYVMSSVKGSKMPRGDKNFIMQYPLSYPSELEQTKISNFIGILTKRIEVQNKIIKHRKSLIFSLVIEILLSLLSLIESALSLNVFSFFNNLLKLLWTIFKEVKDYGHRKKHKPNFRLMEGRKKAVREKINVCGVFPYR